MEMNKVQIETIFDSITPVKNQDLHHFIIFCLQINVKMLSLGLAVLTTENVVYTPIS